jgi:hypothetical protein
MHKLPEVHGKPEGRAIAAQRCAHHAAQGYMQCCEGCAGSAVRHDSLHMEGVGVGGRLIQGGKSIRRVYMPHSFTPLFLSECLQRRLPYLHCAALLSCLWQVKGRRPTWLHSRGCIVVCPPSNRRPGRQSSGSMPVVPVPGCPGGIPAEQWLPYLEIELSLQAPLQAPALDARCALPLVKADTPAPHIVVGNGWQGGG